MTTGKYSPSFVTLYGGYFPVVSSHRITRGSYWIPWITYLGESEGCLGTQKLGRPQGDYDILR